jgi:predicted nuclease of predicted toxin-antitoxin system
VRFLIDECLPARLATLLCQADHDCAHVYEAGLDGRPDEQVMAMADRENRVLVSADTDFGELDQLAEDLAAGSLVVITENRIRLRRLPVKPRGSRSPAAGGRQHR